MTEPLQRGGAEHSKWALFDLSLHHGRVDESLLEPWEVARADRFVAADARTNYVRAHGLIRLWVAAELGTDVVDVRLKPFACLHCGGRDHGRPAIEVDRERFAFSLSRSGSLVGMALSQGPIGIDVERLRSLDVDALLGLAFSPSEQSALNGADHNERNQLALRLWTAKEAVTKATGHGLRADLREVFESSSGTWGHDGKHWKVERADAVGLYGAVASEV